jgi:hypothetical protein
MDVRVVLCDFVVFPFDILLKKIRDLDKPKLERECRTEYINF